VNNELSNELSIGKKIRCISKEEKHRPERGITPHNIIVVLPAYNEEVSIGSIVLLTRIHADNVIVVDDGNSDRTAALPEKLEPK
jgi:cellulose synthase/poly-beta-1,6-N-acetylglucosamine synthase-like glycosyltransferase